MRTPRPAAIAALLLLVTATASPDAPWDAHGRLRVSGRSPHHLAYADGTPFFWLGDTAWELFHRLDRGDAARYLDDRTQKEFTVVQAVLLSEFGGLTVPNAYGDLPLLDADPLRPSVTPGADPADAEAYDYWDHAEYVLRQAAARGLFVAALPCWGEFVVPREGHGIFDSGEQAYRYGHFVGARFADLPNVVWVLGGDRHPDERPEGPALWRAMAEGIADGVNGVDDWDGEADYGTTLMTHHAFGSSSTWFHDDPWIDFHMWGSYHSDFYAPRAHEAALADRALPDPKPRGQACDAGPPYPACRQPDNLATHQQVRRIFCYSSWMSAGGRV